MIGVMVPCSVWQWAGVSLMVERALPLNLSRKDVLDVVETRLTTARRTHDLLKEAFAGRDHSAPCENGKTGIMLLDEAVANIRLWEEAREFVEGLPWLEEEVRT